MSASAPLTMVDIFIKAIFSDPPTEKEQQHIKRMHTETETFSLDNIYRQGDFGNFLPMICKLIYVDEYEGFVCPNKIIISSDLADQDVARCIEANPDIAPYISAVLTYLKHIPVDKIHKLTALTWHGVTMVEVSNTHWDFVTRHVRTISLWDVKCKMFEVMTALVFTSPEPQRRTLCLVL